MHMYIFVQMFLEVVSGPRSRPKSSCEAYAAAGTGGAAPPRSLAASYQSDGAFDSLDLFFRVDTCIQIHVAITCAQ